MGLIPTLTHDRLHSVYDVSRGCRIFTIRRILYDADCAPPAGPAGPGRSDASRMSVVGVKNLRSQ